jgi:hypothetical protein
LTQRALARSIIFCITGEAKFSEEGGVEGNPRSKTRKWPLLSLSLLPKYAILTLQAPAVLVKGIDAARTAHDRCKMAGLIARGGTCVDAVRAHRRIQGHGRHTTGLFKCEIRALLSLILRAFGASSSMAKFSHLVLKYKLASVVQGFIVEVCTRGKGEHVGHVRIDSKRLPNKFLRRLIWDRR